MDYVINGLPVHVLVVHFVVIVVPVAALALLLTALWPAARRRLGIVTPIIALAALISVPIATEAGEWLQERVGRTDLIEEHEELGETLLPWAVGVFVLAVLQWVWFRFVAPRVPKAGRLAIGIVLAVLVAVAAVGSVVTVIRIGESGSKAVWSGSFSEEPL